MQLTSTFEKLSRRFRVDFAELAAETEHPGEAGSSREEALRELLRNYLPKRVGVGSGFVIDANGGKSRQTDVVIYDRGHASVFKVGYVDYFPCEPSLRSGR